MSLYLNFIEPPDVIPFKTVLDDREDIKHLIFWRTQDKKEVDFIINRSYAIEAKFNGNKYNPKKYTMFREAYLDIPLMVLSFINPKPDYLTLIDFI
jgi:hypothetical protein